MQLETLPGLLVALPLGGAALLPVLAALTGRRTGALAIGLHALIAAGAVALMAGAALSGPVRYAMGGWPGPWGIELVVDGLSGFVLVLVTGVGCAAAVALGAGDRTPIREGLLRGALLLLVAGLSGMTLTRDVFNLFVFLEISSLSAYPLIAEGGGRAGFAAFRYLIAGTVAGSLYLLGCGYLYALAGTLNMDDLSARLAELGPVGSGAGLAVGVALIAAGLAIKAALFPLHGWLPDSYSFAPPAVAGFIGAVMAKVSAYALLRIVGETLAGTDAAPFAAAAMQWLGIAGILVGAALAVGQRRVVRMLAWSSVGSMGMLLLGIGVGSPMAVAGAVFHLAAHAMAKGSLLLAAGGLRDELGIGDRSEYAGLGRRSKGTAAAFTVSAFSLVGLPPTAGFFAKLLLLMGMLEAGSLAGVVGFVAILLSSLTAAVYLFRVLEGVWFREPASQLPDAPAEGGRIGAPGARGLSLPVAAPAGALAVAVLLAGIFSGPFSRHVLPEWPPEPAPPILESETGRDAGAEEER